VPSSTTCVGQEPLKPVHRICGVVFFPSGDRIHNANVSVLEADKEIAIQKTDDNGKFSFDQLKPGNYELRIRVDGVPGIAATKVVLGRPNAKSKKEIAVNISLQLLLARVFLLWTRNNSRPGQIRVKLNSTHFSGSFTIWDFALVCILIFVS
jgi:hypothetical protein